MALNRALRLRANRDFQRVRQQGRSKASRLLILAWAPNDEAHVRVGFVVSKRVSKLAVQRNRTKRRLGEAIRPLVGQIAGSYDIVLSARSAAVSADYVTLRQDVISLLRRARLLKPEDMLV